MNHLQQQLKNIEKNPIILEKELGKGGEGAVFAIKNAPNLVVKIYHQPPTKDKTEKILAMVRLGNERLLNLSTWPLASYYTDKGILTGFIMPRLINHYALCKLYNPKLRLEAFPNADWRFLIHAASNVARAFGVIHDAGHVIGDVNHDNIVVAQDATVRFIDTDSFQIIDNTKCWFCEVGVTTHQPAEMQGLPTFNGVMRTPNHDNFGLAVLIFQLIFLGRHPFSGRFQGTGEMPLEKAIKEHRFAFSSNQSLQMLPPPASLQMTSLTPQLRLLFERAFSKEGSGEQVGLRPTSDEWVFALKELAMSLKPCASNRGHYYYTGIRACPWCDIETKSGTIIFPAVEVKDSASSQENISSAIIAAIWQEAEKIVDPGPEPALPSFKYYSIPPSPKAEKIVDDLGPLKAFYIVNWLFVLIIAYGVCTLTLWSFVAGVLGAILFSFGIKKHYEKRKKELAKDIISELDTIPQDWDRLMTKWKIASTDSTFTKLRQKIYNLKNEYEALNSNREQLVQQYSHKSYQEQLHVYLTSFNIANADIQGVGLERITTLKCHGIQTAADIEYQRLQGIKGFGVVFRTRLSNWRQQLENNFIFNPDRDKSSKQDLLSIDKNIAIKRRQIEAELANAVMQLSTLVQQVHERRRTLSFEATKLISRYSQAFADAQKVGLKF